MLELMYYTRWNSFQLGSIKPIEKNGLEGESGIFLAEFILKVTVAISQKKKVKVGIEKAD